MTRGDLIRHLNGCLRRLSTVHGRPPTRLELFREAGLAPDRFDEGFRACVADDFLLLDGDIIREGPRLMNQKTPAGVAKQPLRKLRFVPGQQPLWERICLWGLAAVLLVLVTELLFRPDDLSAQKWKLAKLVASLLGGVVGAFLPGMLEIQGKRGGFVIRATGALALFVLVFFNL